MPCATSIEEAVQMAERRWSGYEFKITSEKEAHGPCPVCKKATEDGFNIFQDGGYWCRPGGCTGWLDDNQKHTWTSEEIRLRKMEAAIQQLARENREQDSRVSALERIAHCHDHERYHDSAINDEQAVEWFLSQGLKPWAIFDYKLGQCDRCPTDREGRQSYTFPIWRKDGPLWSIRHRLQGATNGDKYRPHARNLGLQLVNAQYLADWSERVICVEGCKKARVIQQYDLPVVGILGKTGFEMRWLNWFNPSAAIYIALDPDAADTAERLGHGIAKTGKEVYVAQFPAKPDDMFVDGATADEWESYLHLARRIH